LAAHLQATEEPLEIQAVLNRVDGRENVEHLSRESSMLINSSHVAFDDSFRRKKIDPLRYKAILFKVDNFDIAAGTNAQHCTSRGTQLV
jgi:predicted transcriptional regulator